MATQVNYTNKARFDAKLTKEQKELFEYAASLGGFRTLTEFILYAVKEKADNIVKDHNTILASQRDKEVFFEALMNPPKPVNILKKAANRYKTAVEK